MDGRGSRTAAAVALLALVGGCTGPSTGSGVRPTASAPESTSASVPVSVEASVDVVATGLDAPWGLAALPDGRFLVTLRDEARLVVVDPVGGGVSDVGGPGAAALRTETEPGGEGGLLGVAVRPADGAQTPVADDELDVFLYRTGSGDNAVVTASLTLAAEPELGPLTTVLDGVAKAGNHNGGRLAFGPDGFLYVSTGDAGEPSRAQDPGSLNGKILRITADGDPAPGNPDPGSPVWSLGHRNVQGLGWDSAGRMLASEFGQNTWDELNQVLPGHNYGWPEVEGRGDGFTQPLAVWPTSDASPSGLAVTADAAYLASLRGERLWRVPFAPSSDDESAPIAVGQPQALLTDQGRLRAVVSDADGALWVLTNNTDGRGSPRQGDDRLLRVVITNG